MKDSLSWQLPTFNGIATIGTDLIHDWLYVARRQIEDRPDSDDDAVSTYATTFLAAIVAKTSGIFVQNQAQSLAMRSRNFA